MRFPQVFYGEKPTLGEVFGHENTGNLSVARLLAQQPPWKKSISKVSPLCKKLVLTDCTAPYWLPEKINAVIVLIRKLQESGFEFYLWQKTNKELLLIKDPDCFFFDSPPLADVRPFDTDELIEIASRELSSPRNNICLVDERLIDIALEMIDESDLRRLSLYHFMRMSKKDQIVYIENLKKAGPVDIILNDYLADTSEALALLQENFPIAKVEIKKYAILLDENVQEEQLRGQSVVHYLLSMTQEQFELALSNDMMKSFAPLEGAAILWGNDVDGDGVELEWPMRFARGSLPHLQRFVLHPFFSIGSDEDFALFLMAAFNLTEVSCQSVSGENSFFDILTRENINFPYLRKVTSSNIYADADLLRISQGFPNLVTFDLGMIEDPDSFDLMCSCGNMDFSGCTCGQPSKYKVPAVDVKAALLMKQLNTGKDSFEHCEGLYYLLALAKNLIELTMIFPYFDLKSVPQLSMSSLTRLNIRLSPFEGGLEHNVTQNTFWRFINSCPVLKTLHISSDLPIPAPFRDALTVQPELNQLEHLIISDLEFTPGNSELLKLLAPLQFVPNLRAITLQYSVLDNCILGSLANVERISLIACAPSADFFKKIAGAPKLKRLNLSNSVNKLYKAWMKDEHPPIDLIGVKVIVSKEEFLPENRYKILSIISHAELEEAEQDQELVYQDSLTDDGDNDPHDLSDDRDPEPHNSLEMLNYRPRGNIPFVFNNNNISRNQEMIQDRLCHYLQTCQSVFLRDKPYAISSIQDGICVALAYFFNARRDLRDFDNFLSLVLAWDCQSLPSSELERYFIELLNWVAKSYWSSKKHLLKYVGSASFFKELQKCFPTKETLPPAKIADDLMDLEVHEEFFMIQPFLLESFNTQEAASVKFIVSNPWHSISLIQTSDSRWVVYDPNYTQGPKEFDVTLREEQELLFKAIKDALGDLLFIETENFRFQFLSPLCLSDKNRFIKEGGLLALLAASNPQTIISELLSCHDFPMQCDVLSLSGILLRSVHRGFPAWYDGINHTQPAEVQTITWLLLEAFVLKNPHDFEDQLQESLELVEPYKVKNTLEEVRNTLSAKSHAVRALYLKKAAATKFQTLLSESNIISPSKNIIQRDTDQMDVIPDDTHTSLADYCASCIDQSVKKRLITLHSSKSTGGLQYALQQYCLSQGLPVFVATKPEDFICSGNTIKVQKNRGVFAKGPGGLLHDFLTQHQGAPALLIINYDEIKDVISLNSVLDDVGPHADGTPIPDSLLIIGIINASNPDCYLGGDFTSRFNTVDVDCPVSSAQLESAIPALPLLFSDEPMPYSGEIHLFNDAQDDWKQRLLGGWVLKGSELVFEEGELARALAQGNVLKMVCGPWTNTNFVYFWQQAFLYGFIPYTLGAIPLPDGLRLICSSHYDWGLLAQKISFSEQPFEDVLVMNPAHFDSYFKRYEIDKTSGLLFHSEGLVKAHAGTDLSVTVTHPISDDQWAMLLSECLRWEVRLIAHCSPGVTLPDPISANRPPAMDVVPVKLEQINPLLRTQVVISTDFDTTVALFCQAAADWTVLDVSGCEPSDLLNRTEHFFDPELSTYTFVERESYFLQELRKGKSFILKGSFSDELVFRLAGLLLARGRDESHGRLVFISDDKTRVSFSFYPTVRYHEVSREEKKKFLRPDIDELDAFMGESLSKLRARERYLVLQRETTRDTNSDNAWIGLQHLPLTRAASGETTIEEFTERRREKLEWVLGCSPFVYIAGLSGVGKSTFIQNDFPRDTDRLYQGINNLEAWLADTEVNTRKLLFIDEATLTENWSLFEGLFNQPPGLFIKGGYRFLTEQHKVIFAGNPVTYGSGRSAAHFFQRHGNCVVFDPIPPLVIAHQIIEPIFFKSKWRQKEVRDSCQVILNVYDYLCERSTTEILVSPRELQMMALQAIVLSKQSGCTLYNATKEIVWRIGSNCLSNKNDIDFNARFKPEQFITYDLPNGGDVCITPSRKQIWQELHEHLLLSELRHHGQLCENRAQQYGGLGGIIIEGPPGSGKSMFVKAVLKSRGYEEWHWGRGDIREDGPYYYNIPASMPIEVKMAVLLRAFNEGVPVVFDEMNAASALPMEEPLNGLLMGKSPDGKPPLNPGFTIFGTQNPVMMGGNRLKASTALLRRLQQVMLPDYPSDELIDILGRQFGPKHLDLVHAAVYALMHQCKKNRSLTVKPTNVRELSKLIEAEISKLAVRADDELGEPAKGNARYGYNFFGVSRKRPRSDDNVALDSTEEHAAKKHHV